MGSDESRVGESVCPACRGEGCPECEGDSFPSGEAPECRECGSTNTADDLGTGRYCLDCGLPIDSRDEYQEDALPEGRAVSLTADQLRGLIKEELAGTSSWVAPVQEAAAALKRANRYTAFGQWYKGDHGQMYNALKAAVRTAIKAERGNNPVVGPLTGFLESLVKRSTDWDLLDQAVAASTGGR